MTIVGTNLLTYIPQAYNFWSNRLIEKLSEAIVDPWLFKVSVVDLGIAVALLATHHMTGLTVARISVIAAGIILVFGGNPIKKTPQFLEKIYWLTLIFLRLPLHSRRRNRIHRNNRDDRSRHRTDSRQQHGCRFGHNIDVSLPLFCGR